MGKAMKAAPAGCSSVYVDQAIRSRNARERSEENAVHHTENRGIGADAKRQRDSCDGSKAGSLQQASNPVANVSEECFHGFYF
jgi:hypothetical protein